MKSSDLQRYFITKYFEEPIRLNLYVEPNMVIAFKIWIIYESWLLKKEKRLISKSRYGFFTYIL